MWICLVVQWPSRPAACLHKVHNHFSLVIKSPKSEILGILKQTLSLIHVLFLLSHNKTSAVWSKCLIVQIHFVTDSVGSQICKFIIQRFIGTAQNNHTGNITFTSKLQNLKMWNTISQFLTQYPVLHQMSVQLFPPSFFFVLLPTLTIVLFDLEWDAVRRFLEHKHCSFP